MWNAVDGGEGMSSDVSQGPDVSERTVGESVSAGVHVTGTTVWRLLTHTGVYLALIAAAEVLLVRHLLALPPSPAPVVGFCITFAVYANDRIVDLDDDALSRPDRTAFVRRYRSELYVAAALAYGVGTALAALGGPVAFGLALLPGATWVLYAVNWAPSSAVPFRRLKEIPVVNSILVASAWTLPVILLPMEFADASLTPAVGALFAYFVLATFVNTEIANVGDVETDTESGVGTLPVLLGMAGTRIVLYGVTLLTGLVLGYAAYSGYLSVASAVALAVGPTTLVGMLPLVGRYDDNLLTVAAECSRLPVLAVLALSAV